MQTSYLQEESRKLLGPGHEVGTPRRMRLKSPGQPWGGMPLCSAVCSCLQVGPRLCTLGRNAAEVVPRSLCGVRKPMVSICHILVMGTLIPWFL